MQLGCPASFTPHIPRAAGHQPAACIKKLNPMAEKFFLILSVILQTLMAALLIVQIIRADITAVIIHTLLITFTTGILLTAIEEYRQSKHQNP